MTAHEPELRRLMIAGQAGDAAAYRTLLDHLSRHLRGYYKSKLINYGRSSADAEDLVQDVIIAIHTRRHTYSPDQLFTPWVHAIARYKLIDLLRSRSGREALHDPLEDDLLLFASNDHEAADARRDINTLLEQLPDNQRLPIVHTKLEGLSVTEAASVTGMSESAIKVGVHRGMKALAALMNLSLRNTP